MNCAEGRRDSGRSNTDKEQTYAINSAKNDDDESDSVGGSEKANSEEGKKERKKLGRKAAWKESQVTDMVNVICNDEKLVRKLIFTNARKSSNTDAYEKVMRQLGNDFPFTVKQMRNKFKWCISICKKVCLTIKTASGISNFVEDKGYGKWFDLLHPLVKSRDSCQPKRAYEPSAQCSKDEDDHLPSSDDDKDYGSTSSSVTETFDKLPLKSKSLLVKKPKSKKGKSDHVSKVLERMYFQMMCGFVNSNVHGNPHHYRNLHLDSVHSMKAQSISLSIPHRGSSTPYTPPLSSEAESVSATNSSIDCIGPNMLPLPSRDINISASMSYS